MLGCATGKPCDIKSRPMNRSFVASSTLPTPLEQLKAQLQRSVDRSGPDSLYSRMLTAEITRYEAVLRARAVPAAARYSAPAA